MNNALEQQTRVPSSFNMYKLFRSLYFLIFYSTTIGSAFINQAQRIANVLHQATINT